MAKLGTIDSSELNNPPEKHEQATARFFAKLGQDIKFIRPTNVKGVHTPDFWMNGLAWEVKSPRSSRRSTIEHSFKAAVKQSDYIIFDLRRIKQTPNKAIKHLQNLLKHSRKVKQIMIITKNGQILKM